MNGTISIEQIDALITKCKHRISELVDEAFDQSDCETNQEFNTVNETIGEIETIIGDLEVIKRPNSNIKY